MRKTIPRVLQLSFIIIIIFFCHFSLVRMWNWRDEGGVPSVKPVICKKDG